MSGFFIIVIAQIISFYSLTKLYRILLIDNYIADKSFYKTAFIQVYQVLGANYNMNYSEINYNSRICLKEDIFKLSHPDTIQEDVYCQRMSSDSILSVYNKKCFTLAHQEGKALRSATKVQILDKFQSLSIFHGYPYSIDRRIFMFTRCVFQTNIALQVGRMASKSYAQEGLTNYEQILRSKNASQACLQDINFYPKSFSLDNDQQCEEILNILFKKYELNITINQEYILKSNAHLGQGLILIDNQIYEELMIQFDDGKDCDKQMGEKIIIQELINNPVLLKQRKIDFRIWFFVVQTSPLIMYIYNHTGIMTCFDVYDKNKLTQYNFNCNSGVARDYFMKNKTDAKDPLTLQDIHDAWTFSQWGQYLKSLGLIQSDDWWKTEFLPQIETLITYYMKILLKKPQSDQRLSGLYAFDATINRDLQVKLYDFNTGPNYQTITRGNIILQKMLHENTFQLLQLYMQQRYTRLKVYLKESIIPELKRKQKIDKQALAEVLMVRPLEHRQVFQWYQVNQAKSVFNCATYDPNL